MAVSADSTGAPASPPAPISLTRKGEAYALENQTVVYFRLGTSPTLATAPDGTAVREAVEQEIDRLIELLDAMDDDPDLEPDVDGEPSIGGNAPWGIEVDLERDDCDDEPSLGSRNPSAPSVAPLGFWRVRPYWISEADWAADLSRHNDVWAPRVDCQTNWAIGCNDDREDEHDGAEPENEHGTDLDAGESDGLENGEADPAECDGGIVIPGGNEIGLGEVTRRDVRNLASAGWEL